MPSCQVAQVRETVSPTKSVLNLDNNRVTVENRAAWFILLSPLFLGIYVFTVMKMILMFQETTVYDLREETRKQEEKREEKFGRRVALIVRVR